MGSPEAVILSLKNLTNISLQQILRKAANRLPWRWNYPEYTSLFGVNFEEAGINGYITVIIALFQYLLQDSYYCLVK